MEMKGQARIKPGRVQHFDILKCISIILVIFTHRVSRTHPVYNYIISFHMPVFFIISGYFFKARDNRTLLKNIFQRMLLPYCFTWAVILAWDVAEALFTHTDLLVIKNHLLAFILGSSKAVGGMPGTGPIWFLIALAVGSLCLNICLGMSEKYAPVLIALLAYAGHVTAQKLLIPFSIQAGMFSSLYICFGYLIKKHSLLDLFEGQSAWLLLAVSFTAIYCYIRGGSIHISEMYLPQGLFTVVGAGITSMTVIFIVKKLHVFLPTGIRDVLAYLGENSLFLLCAHTVQMYMLSWGRSTDILWLELCISTLVPMLALLLLQWFPLVRRTFHITTYVRHAKPG